MLQGQSEDVSEQLNEEEQLLVISRLHQVIFAVCVKLQHLHGHIQHYLLLSPKCVNNTAGVY